MLWPATPRSGTSLLFACLLVSVLAGAAKGAETATDGATVKAALRIDQQAKNLLSDDGWRPYERGFQRDGAALVCDNATDASVRRGAVHSVVLNQTRPEPIVAVAWSKAEGVTGTADNDYALYLDLVHQDGSSLWGQAAPFAVGSHDWQRRQVVVLADKPVKSVSVYLLFRRHGGKVWFRDARFQVVRAPAGSTLFDGVPVVPRAQPAVGFQLRDVAAGSDFVRLTREALGVTLKTQQEVRGGATYIDATLTDTTGKDRAVTLVYALPVGGPGVRWLADPRRSEPADRGECMLASRFRVGANGRLSRYPLAAVASGPTGTGLGIDMARPAFYRIGYNPGTGELFLAYDLALTREKPSARIRLCHWTFDPTWGFRAALARYYELFPEAFRCRTPRQGNWMPFARISQVQNWQDFGFQFKEGDGETAWDDRHGITTFRYTEPMTWWMRMPKPMPRTMAAAEAEARRLAREKNDPAARAWLTSGYHGAGGEVPARLLDTPWCNGAVWSMNSMPGIAGDVTHFKLNWNPELRERLYGPKRQPQLDGEYIDSSEGYVTDELDYRREHFAAADTPLSFAPESHRPAIFRGLIAFEYVRAIERDVHGMGKLMMANGAPTQLCWLVPLIDVAGTETDWHRQGRWQPMADADLLYRRALCRGKPYCFLMNTDFDAFPHALVERYMRRSLAYGMFPGFFSHNASERQYFQQPALYNRDRPLFKKYVPLCKRIAEAGWEPITLARCSDEKVYVERFGKRYLTVFNDSDERRRVTVTLDAAAPGLRATATARELVADRPVDFRDGAAALSLDAEAVALIDLGP